MAWTYTAGATSKDLVRQLIPDVDTANQIFTDEEIAAFLSMEGGVVKLAAADALEAIASNIAITVKDTEVLDLKVAGSKTSDALLKRASELRKQVKAALAGEYEAEAFDIAEMVTGPADYIERMQDEYLREA